MGWPLNGTGFGTTSTCTVPVLGGSVAVGGGVVPLGAVGDESLHITLMSAAPHARSKRPR